MTACQSALVCMAVCLALAVGVQARTDHTHRHRHQHHETAIAEPAASPATQQGVETDPTAAAMSVWKERQYSELLAPSHLVVPGTPLPWSLGENSYTIQRPEGLRSFFVYVPISFNSQYEWSLVLALHGLGDHAQHFSTRTNLTQIADSEGFLLIYPQGSTGDLGTGWNAGTCCVSETIDDVGFLTAILEQVMGTFPVRQDSVHAMGFSNGGFMTERLGCENSTLFKSIGSVSGNTIVVWGGPQALAACDAMFQSPTSILHVHGNLDFVVPWTGDELLGWGTIPDDLAAWAKRNHCPSPPIQTFNVSTFSNQLWQGCGPEGAYQVELVLNQGGGHIWPMVPGVFEVTNYILDFWTRVTPGGLAPVSPQPEEL